MKLKFYAFVPNSETACEYYRDLFDGHVIKEGLKAGHAYLKLFGEIGLHINSINKMDTSRGKLIIKFEDGERMIYDQLLTRIQNKVDLQINRLDQSHVWGTTLTEIQDKYGYIWVFEIPTKD